MVLLSEASSGPVAKVPVTASGVVAILTIGYIGYDKEDSLKRGSNATDDIQSNVDTDLWRNCEYLSGKPGYPLVVISR